MKNWEKEDKNVTNLWNKMEYFDPQPIIWVSKNSLFSMFKMLKNVLKSGYLFAWGIEKQHKKVKITWYKIEYFHSQPIIRYPHSKKVFWKSTKFWLLLSRFTKNCENQQKLLVNHMIFKFLGCQNIHSRAENVQNHVFTKNTRCRAETLKMRFFKKKLHFEN